MTFSINELKDMCNNAFKRNSIYPLMEIPKPDSKYTIEEQFKKQAEVFPGWNDINRVNPSEIWNNKDENIKNKETERYIRTMENK